MPDVYPSNTKFLTLSIQSFKSKDSLKMDRGFVCTIDPRPLAHLNN